MSVIIVTGGSSGIGASTAMECARRGFGVILTYKSNPGPAQEVVNRIAAEGGKAVALKLDVGDAATFGAFRGRVESALGENWQAASLAGLVNNAGYAVVSPIETVTVEQFDGLMSVLLKGPLFLTQSLLSLLEDGAAIVNVTSSTIRVASPGLAPYAALKGGLDVLTRYMAKEFGERGIRVNSVSPGATRTELGGGSISEYESYIAGQTALGRIAEPQDIAQAIASLLTPNGWINAQSIEVSGGYLI